MDSQDNHIVQNAKCFGIVLGQHFIDKLHELVRA